MPEQTDPREGADFFLNDPKKLNDPFPDLKYFRENRPVFFYQPLNQWFVFDYDNVTDLFADPRLSSDRMKGFIDAAPAEVRTDLHDVTPYLEKFVMFEDDPDHTRIRTYLHQGFNATAIDGLTGQVQQIADELLDRVQTQGHLDASADYGFLLPAYALSDFLGFPKEDRPKVLQWALDFIGFFNVQPISVTTTEPMVRSATEMIAYTKTLLAQRRASPQHDYFSSLADDTSDQLSEDETVANAMLFLLAGHIAPRNLIGNAIWLLLTNPDQFAKLRSTPELLNNALEETLRYEPPVTLIPRITLQDIEVNGITIRAGQIVQLSIASANRDAKHFPNPDTFDIARQPGEFLSFGHGPHGCMGAHLAMLEAQVALETLFRRMPNLKLDPSREIVWYRNAANRGPTNLPLTF